MGISLAKESNSSRYTLICEGSTSSHLYKRDAEADAGLVLAHPGYGYAYGFPYAHYPVVRAPVASSYQHVATPAAVHGLHQLHKREAEAEPEADAYYVSFYGRRAYGYGYGYPHYGYGYRSYGYGYPYAYYGRYHY